MKIPSGKAVYVGNRLYRAGEELPDDIARKAGLLKERIETPKPTKKKGNEFTGTSRSGFGANT